MGKLRWHKHTGILKKKEATRTNPFSGKKIELIQEAWWS
jgi:hypothetical protein